MARLSIVGSVYIINVSAGSTVQVGDHVTSNLQSRTFAVQREIPYSCGNEGSFDAYSFYQRPFAEPQPPQSVTMHVDNLGSFIRVQGIKILDLSSSSLLQIGSNRVTISETRVKNIRQFVANKPGPKEQTSIMQTPSGLER